MRHVLFLSCLASLALAPVGPAAAADAKAGPKMTVVRHADKMKIKSMNMPGIEAFLEDVVGSDDKVAPIACGMFRIKKSKPLEFDYTYDEAKIILDGTMTISDGHSTATVKKGDVLFFPKGSHITFTTSSSGLGFICGQRPRE
jgi:ethanolamine utilization protein EutQ (cupin superfamily)